MGCSPPGSSAHGILQEGILEWVFQGIFYRESFDPRIEPGSPHCWQFLYHLSHQEREENKGIHKKVWYIFNDVFIIALLKANHIQIDRLNGYVVTGVVLEWIMENFAAPKPKPSLRSTVGLTRERQWTLWNKRHWCRLCKSNFKSAFLSLIYNLLFQILFD